MYFSSFKEAGMDWLDTIPEHWLIKRLKFTCKINPSKSEISRFPENLVVSFLPMERIGEDGTLSLKESQAIEQVRHGYTYFCDGDVIVAKITPCFENGKGALCEHLLNGIGFGTTELHVLRANQQIVHPKFLYYVTKSYSFRERGTAAMYGSAGQQRVPEDFVSNFLLNLPPLPEQYIITAYLDRKIAEIDRFITNKGKLIGLLKEQKTALINQTITGGLNPDVKLKLSNMEWLGEIPEHWEVRRAKYYFTEVDERSETGEEELLSVSHITGVTPRSEKNVTMFMAESYEGYKVCQPGDLVINIMWAWMGALGVSEYSGIVSSSYGVYRQKQNYFNRRYLDLLLRTKAYVAEFTRRSTGIRSSRLRMYTEDFFGIPIVQPPLDEQERIVHYIEHEQSQIDKAISLAAREIALIKEFRTVLIAEATTGKIDVRALISEKVLKTSGNAQAEELSISCGTKELNKAS